MERECPTCFSLGYIQELCPFCNGSGEGQADRTTCPFCKGKGETYYNCPDCNNQGILKKENRPNA